MNEIEGTVLEVNLPWDKERVWMPWEERGLHPVGLGLGSLERKPVCRQRECGCLCRAALGKDGSARRGSRKCLFTGEAENLCDGPEGHKALTFKS